MSFFSKLWAHVWSPYHRVDPRLHNDGMPEDNPEDWDPGSTTKYLSESHRQWVDSIVKQASTFPFECFIQFQFHPTQYVVTCYRIERFEQPRLELGLIENIPQKYWAHFWRFLYDRFDSSITVEPLSGEEKRELVLWVSPRKNTDPYSMNPNAVCIKLCVDYSMKATKKTGNCSLDGPCTAH